LPHPVCMQGKHVHLNRCRQLLSVHFTSASRSPGLTNCLQVSLGKPVEIAGIVLFTGKMPLLMFNQEHQSTEDIDALSQNKIKIPATWLTVIVSATSLKILNVAVQLIIADFNVFYMFHICQYPVSNTYRTFFLCVGPTGLLVVEGIRAEKMSLTGDVVAG